MNFNNVFEELNKLYEEKPTQKPEDKVEEGCKEKLAEAAEDEVPADEVPVEEAEVKQLILECAKCGALVIKDEADVVVDEATDLVNVEDACAYCEETEGYKIIGTVIPYEATEEVEEEPAGEEAADAEDVEEEPVEEALKETYYACAEIDGEERRFPFNDREAARRYIADIKAGKAPEFAGKQVGSVWTEGFDPDEQDLEELFDITPSVNLSLDGGEGNDVDVL